METDDWPAWGRLIDEARGRLRPTVSQNEAARRAGITGTHWRQIVKGEAGDLKSTRGVRRVARMAEVVGVTPEELETAGRPDVAEDLRIATAEEARPRRSAAELAELVRNDPELAAAMWELIEAGARLRARQERSDDPDSSGETRAS